MAVLQHQVERLQARCGVSETAARAALEQTGGDLLAAVLFLEQEGQTPKVKGGTYSTAANRGRRVNEGAYRATGPRPQDEGGEVRETAKEQKTKGAAEDADGLSRAYTVLRDLKFEVWRKGKRTMAIPAVLMVVLLCIRFPLGLALLSICLLLGCRYRLTGPDFPGMSAINAFLDGAYALCADLTGQQDKHKKDRRNG